MSGAAVVTRVHAAFLWAGIAIVGMSGACLFELEPPLNDGLPGARPVVLATSQAEPWAMALDATHVYWTNLSVQNTSAGSIMRAPKDASSGPVIIGNKQAPGIVALDDTHIYWTTRINSDGRVLRRLKSGGATETVVGDQDDPIGVAVDGEYVYWTDSGRGTIYKRPKNDPKAPSVELASGQMRPWLIVLGNGWVYWTNREGRSVMRVAKEGGPSQMLASTLQDVFGIAVDDTAVFFRDADENRVGRVMRLSLANMQVVQLASTTGEGARFLALDEANIYWTNGSNRDGAIMMSLKDGTGAMALATSLPGPRGIVVDGTDVFWSNYSGATIMKIEKPRKGAPPATSRGAP